MKEDKTRNNHAKTVISRIRVWEVFIGLTMFALLSSCTSVPLSQTPKATLTLDTAYYIDDNLGSDSNPGTRNRPWKTIQKCLNQVWPGGTCQVANGIYNEALTLITTGTEARPIIIKCETEKGCTVNSGKSKTLVTGGRIHYYTIEGFRLVASYTPTEQLDVTVDLSQNIWDGETTKEGGNNGFTLRGCYIEGALIFYGHNNLVENCELNGKGIWSNGITERMATSHDNVFRNNIVHDYQIRGFWSNHATDNVIIEGNTIYNLGSGGVDCDGASVAVTRCNIRGNNIFNATTGEGYGILLENAFDSVVEGNNIHDVVRGISAINYNKNNGDDPFQSSADYKSLRTNTILRNNVIYNASQDGILCKAVVGNKAINNTLYNIQASPGYWGAIGMAGYGGYFCNRWEIKNNIVSQAVQTVWYEDSAASPTAITIDYNLYDADENETKFLHVVRTPDAFHNYTFSHWKETLGLDNHSFLGNPLFVNAAAGDFRLPPNSPACTAGEDGTYVGAFPCNQ